MNPTQTQIKNFQKTIKSWYKTHKRDLPWRNTTEPYHILVSEIMLQQTQVSRVLVKYPEFLKAFPTIQTLASAKDSTLLKTWNGLGYWRRAKYLKETAKIITKTYNNEFPHDTKTLQTLPGIGHYTAGAVSCFAFNTRTAFMDTNIKRVYLHFFFPNKKEISDKELLQIAQQALPQKDCKNWHYALFDYGASVLKNTNINKQSKSYRKQNKFKGSFRSFRAKTLKHLLAEPNQKTSKAKLLDFIEDALRQEEADYSSQEILDSLIKDKLVKTKGNSLYL